MPISIVIAYEDTFATVEMKYHILSYDCKNGSIYYDSLFLESPLKPILCTSAEAMCDLSA